MSIFRFNQVFVYYSIAKYKYAGWKRQVSLIMLSLDLPHTNYYKDEFGSLRFLLDIIFCKEVKKVLIVLPNLYGINKFLWWILSWLKINVLPRVSGGELRIFEKYRWLAAPFQTAPIWVLNRNEYNLADKLGFKPHIINNLVTPVDYKVNREVHALSDMEFTILMCGSISKRKGQFQILEWLEDLGFRGEIYLVGPTSNVEKEKGSYFEKLKKIIPELNYKVQIVGEVLDVSNYYRQCDLMILNSAFEGLPNVVLEALSHKLPVLGTRVQGTEDILSKLSSNLLFDLGDYSSFSKSFNWIQSSVNYQEVANSCEIVIEENYSLNVVKNQFIRACYQSA